MTAREGRPRPFRQRQSPLVAIGRVWAEVIVPTLPDDHVALEEVLTKVRGARVQLRTAQRGVKAELLKTAQYNAAEALKQYKLKRTADFVSRTDALNDLREALGVA